MKIAIVLDGVGTGGIERVGTQYATLLSRLGHSVDLYNLKPHLNDMEKNYTDVDHIYHKKFSIWMMPDQYVLLVKRWWWGKYLYPICYLLSSIVLYAYRLTMGKRKKYDLAIAFSGHFFDLNFVSKNFIKSDKKMCWLHGSLIEYLATASTYGDQYRKIKNLCVLSEANQSSAISMNRFLSDLNINHIYNPMDVEAKNIDMEHVRELNEKYGHFLLMIGRFEVDKDQESVIRAYKIIKDNKWSSDKLLFAGNGSTKESCVKLVEQLGLQDDVIFVGNRTDVQDFYTAAKIFIHSSPAEGLPTVLLESMKYGTPIVATRSMPGVEEILEGNTYGLQCNVADPQDIAEKVKEMLDEEGLRKHYIELGYERILDFSYDKIMKQLDDIIKSLQ